MVSYEAMKRCWNEDPQKRPSFSELREFMEAVLNSDKKTLKTPSAEITLTGKSFYKIYMIN